MTSRIGRVGREVSRAFRLVAVMMLFVGAAARTAAADDLVLKWNDIAARTAVATNPFNQARIMAIAQLAVFEAVNAVTGEYEPYLNPPTAAAPGASVDAAVVTAAHRVLTTYFSAPATVLALNSARDADLATIPNGPDKTAGVALGLAAANAMIALRANDGSATPPLTKVPSPPFAIGDYQLTTGCTAGLFFNWPNVTPFAISSPADFLLPAPPSLSSQEYAKRLLRNADGGCDE